MLNCSVIGGGYPTSNRSQGVATTKCAHVFKHLYAQTQCMFWCGVHTNQDPPNHIQLTKEGAWSGCSMVWIYGVEWCTTACDETAREHINVDLIVLPPPFIPSFVLSSFLPPPLSFLLFSSLSYSSCSQGSSAHES